MHKVISKKRKIFSIAMFVFGILLMGGIIYFLKDSFVGVEESEAANTTVTISEYCVYKNGTKIFLGSITLKDGASAKGRVCPPARNGYALSYKIITRSGISSKKSVSGRMTYSDSGTKTLNLKSLPASFMIKAPAAGANYTLYQLK